MSRTSRQRTAKPGANDASSQRTTEVTKTPPGFAELQAALQNAMEEMSRFSGTLSTLQADVTSVKNDQGQIKTDVSSILQRLDEAENRISELEDDRESWKQQAKANAKECSELRAIVTDMVNREKRLNVRIFGLKEKKGSQVRLRERVGNFFANALGVNVAKSELQMVHRVPSEKSEDEEAPPRPVIVRFHSFLEKERVMTAVKAKARMGTGIQWDDCNVSVFPDMTREVANRRKQFNDARKKLHELNVRFTFALPATLRFTWMGKKVSFTDPNKAMGLLCEERVESGADDADQDEVLEE